MFDEMLYVWEHYYCHDVQSYYRENPAIRANLFQSKAVSVKLIPAQRSIDIRNSTILLELKYVSSMKARTQGRTHTRVCVFVCVYV